ncbi:MAG: DALR anticodon-binding domain-containing protein, partial [Candidatus Micrarchaeaceae archaeon]
SIRHLAYGEVELESGALSGRKGTWLGFSADDLIREAELKARNLMSGRFKFSESGEQYVISSVALSAIKFEFLKISPERKIVFSWGSALSFEGNSGPYAQYMHARSARILEGSRKELLRAALVVPDMNGQEFELLKSISMERTIAEKAAAELRPNVIAEYINELAYRFAVFYEHSPVLKAESEAERIFRLRITLSFNAVMKDMLELIGIEALDKM